MSNEEICGVCEFEEPPPARKRKGGKKAKNKQIEWICCDVCLGWFHISCVRINDSIFQDIKSYIYQCGKCCVIGSLTPRITSSPDDRNRIDEISKQIEELIQAVGKLQKEASESRTLIKKQMDYLRTKLAEVDRFEEKQLANIRLVEGIDEKLEEIKVGAKLATSCSQRINCCRISINKVPFRPGENVQSIVKDFLCFLGAQVELSNVQTCFRLPVKPSKWTDRTLTPAILVEFSNREVRNQVLKRYYDKHKEAKLCNLSTEMPLEYRFTVNEMLSVDSFRVRNFALRLKQRKHVESVYVKNDHISVRLPGHERYTPVSSIKQLLELISSDKTVGDTTEFFDAQSAENFSFSQL